MFVLLAFVILAEIRGETSVHVMGRRVRAEVQRQALTVALLGVGAVIAGTLILLVTTAHGFGVALFEATSAFGTSACPPESPPASPSPPTSPSSC